MGPVLWLKLLRIIVVAVSLSYYVYGGRIRQVLVICVRLHFSNLTAKLFRTFNKKN